MRNAFAEEVTKLADGDKRIIMLSADIGNRLFDPFRMKHADRFYNCGIAEANMISLAAGLASCGLRPVCYTITPFITTRCLEQIRVDVCYHKMPVIIVGTGAGLSYASLGVTHHSLEDLAILRTLPGMRVLAPADSMELRSCLRAALQSSEPVYIRIGKKGEPVVFSEPPPFAFGIWCEVQHGERACLLSTGNMLPQTLHAAELMQLRGFHPEVIACASIKPLDARFLDRAFKKFEIIATIEEHGKIGGFGAAVAEWMVDNRQLGHAQLIRFGVEDQFLHKVGNQDYAREICGLSAEGIADTIIKNLTFFD
jgi:transketolase